MLVTHVASLRPQVVLLLAGSLPLGFVRALFGSGGAVSKRFPELNLPAPAVQLATGRARECNPLAPVAEAAGILSQRSAAALWVGRR